MSPEWLFWISLSSLLVTAVGATGTKVLHEFSRHELNALCRRRHREELFGEILDRHEHVAMGAETLQTIASVAFVLATGFREVVTQSSVALPEFLVMVALIGLALLVVNTWIPWAIVRLRSAPVLYYTWPFWRFIGYLLWPIIACDSLAGVLARRLAGSVDDADHDEDALDDEIRTIVTEGQREGLLDPEEREMIEGVIDLGDTDVADIMTPRSEIDAVDVNLPWPEIVSVVIHVRRTRIPVYDRTLDNMLGVLYVKDLLPALHDASSEPPTPIRDMLRPPWFVPRTIAVDDMLQEFRRNRNHLAIVVDEYQAVAGVVTIEDVLEEIVGEIEDEFDRSAEDECERVDPTTVLALGRVHLVELNALFGLNFPEPDDFDTIGGLVVSELGHIPKTGESIFVENVQVVVTEASRRRVEKVRIDLQPVEQLD